MDSNEIVQNVRKPFSVLFSILVSITGILVSLAVGFGMTQKILTIPFLYWENNIITVVAGWIVIVLTILSFILAVREWIR